MPKAVFSREKMSKPVGRFPVLQFLPPDELDIDDSYQRSIENGTSQRQIGRMAQVWNWDLCQPLVVSRRDEKFYVIDGQHRLAAARMRGDIAQLPCVVVEYGTAEAEARTFSVMNEERKPLSALEKFNAAIVAQDPEALELLGAIESAGLSLAKHTNTQFWSPGQLGNVGGLRLSHKRDGIKLVTAALDVLARAFDGQVLEYAGSIFPALPFLCRAQKGDIIGHERKLKLINTLSLKSQGYWRGKMLEEQAAYEGLGRELAMQRVLTRAMDGEPNCSDPRRGVKRPQQPPSHSAVNKAKSSLGTRGPQRPQTRSLDNYDAVRAGQKHFCEQCDTLRTDLQISSCISPFCPLKKAA